MVASLLRGQFAWRPLYGGQLSRGQFAALSCRVPKNCKPTLLSNQKSYILNVMMVEEVRSERHFGVMEAPNRPISNSSTLDFFAF